MLVWSGKLASEIKSYPIDWTVNLAGETIASSAWSIVGEDVTQEASPALVIEASPAPSFTTTQATVWLGAGTAGITYVLQNTVTTSGGRTLTQQAELPVVANLSSDDLTTVAAALNWIGQPADTDGSVARIISQMSAQVQGELGYKVKQQSYTRTFDGQGLRKLFVPDLPLISVQSLSINGVTVPQGSMAGGSQQAGFYNNASSIALIGYCFEPGFQNIQITYTAGRATVPADLERAVLDWIKIVAAGKALIGFGVNATSIRAGDTGIEFGGKGDSTDQKLIPIPTQIYSVLRRYIRVVPISGF